MDRVFEHGGTTFVWDEEKAAENLEEHGVAFEEAVTVFDDPLFRIKDATRNEEARDAAIGFTAAHRRTPRDRRRIHPHHFSLARQCRRGSLLC